MRDIIFLDTGTPKERRERASRAFLVDYGVTLEGVRGRRRTQDYTRARWALMRFLVDGLGMGYAETGRFLNKDHTSVMHAVRTLRAEQVAIAA